jgi:hypothetical protein
MTNLVEVKLVLSPDDAEKLVDLAGGEDHVNQYAATVIQTLHTDEQASSEGTSIEQALSASIIDLYG